MKRGGFVLGFVWVGLLESWRWGYSVDRVYKPVLLPNSNIKALWNHSLSMNMFKTVWKSQDQENLVVKNGPGRAQKVTKPITWWFDGPTIAVRWNWWKESTSFRKPGLAAQSLPVGWRGHLFCRPPRKSFSKRSTTWSQQKHGDYWECSVICAKKPLAT